MVNTIWIAYASQSLTVHEHNYHLTKLDVLALKWVIVEQFQEYLLWKLFVVKTDNNPLSYIMTIPNLDATQHHWVESFVGFPLSIEYHRGQDNAIRFPDLSHIKVGCRNCEVHPGWNHCGNNRKSGCSKPNSGWV